MQDTIVLYNMKVEKWAKGTLYSLNLQNFLDLYISEDDIPKCIDALKSLKKAIAENREESIKVEVTTKKLDKAFYIVLSTASNIILNEQDYILITLEDITLLKYKQKQLDYTEHLLDRAVNMNMKTTRALVDNVRSNTATFSEQQDAILRIFNKGDK